MSLPLFDSAPTAAPKDLGDSIEARFRAFHRANPGVYDTLVTLARSAKARGLTRYSMRGLFEVVRWHHALRTRGEPFKLNNDFTALYARLVMEREPELEGFFETRKRRTP